MEKKTASDDVLHFACRLQKGTRPTLTFCLKKKHSNAVLRNYVKRAVKGSVLKIQDRKKIDIQVSSMNKFTWKEKPRLMDDLEKFAATIR